MQIAKRQRRLRSILRMRGLAWLAVTLVVAGLALALFFVYMATVRQPTTVEAILLQVMILGLGWAGTFVFGRLASEGIAKPQARSAFRRMISIYVSLSGMAQRVDECVSSDQQQETLLVLRALIGEQIRAADDAIEDWKDIAPDQVEELMDDLHRNRAGVAND